MAFAPLISLAAVAAAQTLSPTPVSLPASEWTSRMVMSFTPDGDLNGCRLEGSGTIAAPQGAPTNCLGVAVARSHAARFGELPDATANVIFEQKFVPGEVSADDMELFPGDELVSMQLVELDIARDGSVSGCRLVAATDGKASKSDPCEEMTSQFEPPVDRTGRPTAMTGTMIYSIYMRAEVVA